MFEKGRFEFGPRDLTALSVGALVAVSVFSGLRDNDCSGIEPHDIATGVVCLVPNGEEIQANNPLTWIPGAVNRLAE